MVREGAEISKIFRLMNQKMCPDSLLPPSAIEKCCMYAAVIDRQDLISNQSGENIT